MPGSLDASLGELGGSMALNEAIEVAVMEKQTPPRAKVVETDLA